MTTTDVRELGTILGVWAHPDDETYLSAGIMATARRNGQRVVCVTATKGEAGSQDEIRWPSERLAEIREAELATALALLGSPEHRWLGYPDGGCDAVPAREATQRVAEIIDEVAPDTVLTFGPDGQTGHPDHLAVSSWTTAAVRMSSSTPNLYYSTVTPEWWAGPGLALEPLGVWFAGVPSITPPASLAIDFVPDVDLIELKVRALESQVSQTESLIAAVGKDLFTRFVGAETYRFP